MRTLLFLPMAAAVQVLDSSVHEHLGPQLDYEGLKESLLNIHKASEGKKLDPVTITAVQAIMTSINTTLITALDGDRNHTQALLDLAVQRVTDCNIDRTGYFGTGEDWETENADVDSAMDTHELCRFHEHGEHHNMTLHCGIVDQTVCDWTHCGTMPSFAGGDSDRIDEWIGCIQDFFVDYSPRYETERKNCIDATSIHAAKRVDCHGEQGDFEEEFCSREREVQSRCNSYRLCRNREEGSWETTTNETKDLEVIFQAQRVALECLLCYGNKILSNSTDLSDCESNSPCTTLSNCPQITYDDILDFIPCTEPTHPNIPCTTTFHDDFYARYDDSPTLTDSCTPCNPLVENTEGPLFSVPDL